MDSHDAQAEIRRKYDDFASKYDKVDAVPELLGLKSLRKRLLAHAEGDVLEIAVGSGRNLAHYPPTCHLTAIDLSEGMMVIARAKAAKSGMAVDIHSMDAEHLSFPDNTFDTVVDTLSTCTFLDPVKVMREMARVCKPDGKILLLEHGRSNRNWIGRFQDWRVEKHAKQLSCVWNKEPHDMVLEAGLEVTSARRSFFGVFHSITAKPRPIS